MENVGQIPAKSVLGYHLSRKEKFTMTDLKEKDAKLSPVTLIPGSVLEHTFDMPFENFKKWDVEKYYVGLRVKYSINDTKTDEMGTVWCLEKNSIHFEETL